MVPLFFFLLSLQRIWFRSSMDRMKDSAVSYTHLRAHET